MNIGAIILGDDSPTALAVIRDLGRHNIKTVGIGFSKHSILKFSRWCSEFYIRKKDVINQIISISKKHKIKILIAIREKDLIIINKSRSLLLMAGIQPLIPSQSQLDTVLNKAKCINIAQSCGIEVPKSILPKDLSVLFPLNISYPVILKWSNPNNIIESLNKYSIPFIKCEYAQTEMELKNALYRYESVGIYPLIQEYCKGIGIGQMFLSINGNILLEFQHERIHEWVPEGGISSLCKSVLLDCHVDLREKSRKLLKKLSWEGVAMIEYRWDEINEKYYFMEINGRFWGSLPLAINSGVPFASGLIYSKMTDKSQYHIVQPKYKLILCRFMVTEIKRLFRIIFQPSKIKDPFYSYNKYFEILKFIKFFFDKKMTYYVWSIDDPYPLFMDLFVKVKNSIISNFKRKMKLFLNHISNFQCIFLC